MALSLDGIALCPPRFFASKTKLTGTFSLVWSPIAIGLPVL